MVRRACQPGGRRVEVREHVGKEIAKVAARAVRRAVRRRRGRDVPGRIVAGKAGVAYAFERADASRRLDPETDQVAALYTADRCRPDAADRAGHDRLDTRLSDDLVVGAAERADDEEGDLT